MEQILRKGDGIGVKIINKLLVIDLYIDLKARRSINSVKLITIQFQNIHKFYENNPYYN